MVILKQPFNFIMMLAHEIISDKIPDEKDDILGRKRFATEISRELIAYSNKNTDGITMSITGEWGNLDV